MLNFEVLKPENRPDYIDYIIGDQVIAIEFSGRLTKEQADFLNSKQDDVKFLTKQDIIKKPRPLPPELKENQIILDGLKEGYATIVRNKGVIPPRAAELFPADEMILNAALIS